ncbi:MAG: LysM peptidoglycan-binding domain-containing protein [Ferruginibacter sp.]
MQNAAKINAAAGSISSPAQGELVIKGNTRSNGLKAFFANRGTSLLAIAVKADIPLAKLLEYNDLATDGILKNDSWIYLEKKAKQGTREMHTSLQDETLYDISQNNGVMLRSLTQFNNMQENEKVKKGTKIKLRPSQQLTMSK